MPVDLDSVLGMYSSPKTRFSTTFNGHKDLEIPLNSGSILRDEKLTIERLMLVPLPPAFMAFLSADTPIQKQPDQVVHLAAAMFFAGFKNIVATLVIFHRSMTDADGPEIARSIYQNIFSSESDHIDPDDIAYALDEAITKLRIAQPIRVVGTTETPFVYARNE